MSLPFFCVVILLSVPFAVSGNLASYIRSVLQPGQRLGYQYPLAYALSGTGSLLTYLHEVFGWETIGLLELCLPALAFSVLAAAVLSYFRLDDPADAALTGFLLFVGLSYQVNYQYLVVYIPLAILVASKVDCLQRVFALLLAIIPALWLWLFDVSFWFRYFEPQSNEATHILSLVGLTHYPPDYVYVGFALTLMSLSLTNVYITLHTRRGI